MILEGPLQFCRSVVAGSPSRQRAMAMARSLTWPEVGLIVAAIGGGNRDGAAVHDRGKEPALNRL